MITDGTITAERLSAHSVASHYAIESWTGAELLDAVHQGLMEGDVSSSLETLYRGLNGLRDRMFIDEWSLFIQQCCLAHPLRELLHQDPLTHHAFSRPRGYSGDAVLLDFLYGDRPPPVHTPSIGKAVFEHEYETTSASSVRLRRNLIAETIDETALRVPKPSILSIACGHLREAQLSRAVVGRKIGRYVALDNDQASLALVQGKTTGVECLTTIHGSIKTVLGRMLGHRDFDLIYAAGLCDHLPSSIAVKLTTELFALLKPGGRLLFAVFSPWQPERGYMEAFMDLWLLRRDEREIWDLLAEISSRELGAQSLWQDAFHNVTYCRLTRKD